MLYRSLFRRFVLLLLLVTGGVHRCSLAVNAAEGKDPEGKGRVKKEQLGPIELTSKNFGADISNGNKWLIEFYAPWCSHCTAFRGVYDEIAYHLHSEPDQKISVGKVDGDSERALASRFGVKAYPSFYLIDGYSVYKFEGNRSMEGMVSFVKSKYRKQSAIPFFSSPMGPLGLCQGVFLSGAYGAFHAVEWLQDKMGLSPFFAVMVLFGAFFIGIFITIVVLAIALTPKEKND